MQPLPASGVMDHYAIDHISIILHMSLRKLSLIQENLTILPNSWQYKGPVKKANPNAAK
jgi:hypothetical protein